MVSFRRLRIFYPRKNPFVLNPFRRLDFLPLLVFFLFSVFGLPLGPFPGFSAQASENPPVWFSPQEERAIFRAIQVAEPSDMRALRKEGGRSPEGWVHLGLSDLEQKAFFESAVKAWRALQGDVDPEIKEKGELVLACPYVMAYGSLRR